MALTLSRAENKPFDGVCFHCQQSAEKFLKALMEENGLSIPRTHNLLDLHAVLLPFCPTIKPLVRGLVFLKQFAVDVRYPGKNATKRQSASALRWCEKVRRECRVLLGIKPS